MSEEYRSKQVIILRKDLGMRKGKMVAQGAHASLSVILSMIDWHGDISLWEEGGISGEFDLTFSEQWSTEVYIKKQRGVCAWIAGRFAKICCYVKSEEELVELYEKAKEADLPCSLITDSGFTEFNGVPTKTAVAIGPAFVEDVDKITGHLPLL